MEYSRLLSETSSVMDVDVVHFCNVLACKLSCILLKGKYSLILLGFYRTMHIWKLLNLDHEFCFLLKRELHELSLSIMAEV